METNDSVSDDSIRSLSGHGREQATARADCFTAFPPAAIAISFVGP